MNIEQILAENKGMLWNQAIKHSKQYPSTYADEEDMFQEGCLALVQVHPRLRYLDGALPKSYLFFVTRNRIHDAALMTSNARRNHSGRRAMQQAGKSISRNYRFLHFHSLEELQQKLQQQSKVTPDCLHTPKGMIEQRPSMLPGSADTFKTKIVAQILYKLQCKNYRHWYVIYEHLWKERALKDISQDLGCGEANACVLLKQAYKSLRKICPSFNLTSASQ
jgi:RNA polymerase sigma factor (sigma-70 family)